MSSHYGNHLNFELSPLSIDVTRLVDSEDCVTLSVADSEWRSRSVIFLTAGQLQAIGRAIQEYLDDPVTIDEREAELAADEVDIVGPQDVMVEGMASTYFSR